MDKMENGTKKEDQNMKLYTLKSAHFGIVEESLTPYAKVQITNSAKAREVAMKFYDDSINLYESCYVMLLNRSNSVLGYVKIGQGGITSTSVDIRLIMKYALETLTCGMILVHNHPSGNPRPGQKDIQLTQQLKEACQIFDMSLIDHIIVTGDGPYYSFAEDRVFEPQAEAETAV